MLNHPIVVLYSEQPNYLIFQLKMIEKFKYYASTDGTPTTYLIKKYVNAMSAELKTITYDFGNTPKQFSKIDIGDTNVIDIYDVRDSNGNKWYKFLILAQEMVYVDYPNSEQYDKDLAQFKESVPNVLKVIKNIKKIYNKSK